MKHSAELAAALRELLLARDWAAILDPQDGLRPLRQLPSLDLAVVVFPATGAPVWANVLLSRWQPQGLVAEIPPDAAAVRNIRYLADQTDAQGRSIAWDPDAHWHSLRWQPLAGAADGVPMVAPYPASLLKLMVAVGLGRLCDQGRAALGEPWPFAGRRRPLRDWQFDMLAQSCNTATSALVALLHTRGAIRRADGVEVHNELHTLFAALGLPTLRLANTQPDGGWGNAAGAGVGQIQMTAWDCVRLLWWLDPTAPAPPWLRPEAPRLSPAVRDELLAALGAQGLDMVLSSGSLAGVRGQPPGLPNRLQARWLQADGSARVGEHHFPGDLRPQLQQGELHFAHKIGNTENYAADAGIVRGIAPARRHYLVALLSSLGSRYAHHPLACGPRQLAELGAALDARLKPWLEA